jgi:hypothetical protein
MESSHLLESVSSVSICVTSLLPSTLTGEPFTAERGNSESRAARLAPIGSLLVGKGDSTPLSIAEVGPGTTSGSTASSASSITTTSLRWPDVEANDEATPIPDDKAALPLDVKTIEFDATPILDDIPAAAERWFSLPPPPILNPPIDGGCWRSSRITILLVPLDDGSP